jgi:hypothetical protein
VRVALITPPRPTALLGSATQLSVANYCQNCPQLPVVSDRALVDLANLAERGVGEFDSVIADRKSAVGVVEGGDVFADRCLGGLASTMKPLCRIAMSLGKSALLLPGKSVLQIVTGAQRPVQVQSAHCNRHERAGRRLRRGCTASRSSLTSRGCNVLCARSTRPLAWPELTQMMSANVQCVQRAPKLGHAVAAKRDRMLTRNTPCLSL